MLLLYPVSMMRRESHMLPAYASILMLACQSLDGCGNRSLHLHLHWWWDYITQRRVPPMCEHSHSCTYCTRVTLAEGTGGLCVRSCFNSATSTLCIQGQLILADSFLPGAGDLLTNVKH